MNLNPVVVIPTYWCGRKNSHSIERGFSYDHMTPIDQPGELSRCLESLQQVYGLGHIVLLVASEPGVERQAYSRVAAIADSFSGLHISVIGDAELKLIYRSLEEKGIDAMDNTVSLSGYGAIHNLGLVVASVFGHDTVIFVDDDEIVLSPDFMERAVYGLACQTPGGSIITAKTGYFYDTQGKATSPDVVAWYDTFWNKSRGFNAYINGALEGPRLSRANVACGGCMVLHADAYGRVGFDPWIARGEDLDYVLSAHMYSVEVWFDNKLSLQHVPPEDAQHPARFAQDVKRWFYELRKVEFAKTQIDLLQVIPASYNPYPGPWLTSGVARRARLTALLRAIGSRQHGEYWRIGFSARREAAQFARENCANYFEFQHQWPTIVQGMWNDKALAAQLSGIRTSASASSGFTGRFSAVTAEHAEHAERGGRTERTERTEQSGRGERSGRAGRADRAGR